MSTAAVRVTSQQLSNSAEEYVESAADGNSYVVESHGKSAGIVSMERFKRLQEIDEIIDDVRLMGVAAVRMATDNGNRTSLRQLAEMVGINLDELEAED